MAAPSTPTATSIVSEALAKAGENSPISSLTTRANGWLEEVKNDIWMRTKTLKSLQKTKGIIFTQGKSLYSMPTDYAGQGEISMRLLDGSHTGVLQTASSTSLTLAAAENATSDYMLGKETIITSGTGLNEIGQMTSWSNTTKVASTNPAFGTTPVTGDGYLVVEKYCPLGQSPIWDFDNSMYPNVAVRPSTFHPIGNQDYSQFVLDRVPDKTYGGIIRYYVNLMTVDLTSTLLSTLYQKWRNVWLQGVFFRHLENEDDGRAPREKQLYYNLLSVMAAQEMYGSDLHQLQMRCSE